MTFKNLFEPISKKIQEQVSLLSNNQVGKSLDFYVTTFPELEHTKIALIGLDNNFNAVRPFFYSMNQHFKNLQIADLGNLKKATQKNIDTVLKHLLSKGILPIIIGKKFENTFSQYKAYNGLTNIVIMDERIPFIMDKRRKDTLLIDEILATSEENLFNLSMIGYQSHYVDKRVLSYFDKHHFEYLRLGHIRNNLGETEPVIRDADMVAMNLSVLKKIEVPGCEIASPSGIFTEDACQLAYYAGMSDKLTSFGVFGFDLSKDLNHQTAQVVSQILWYFLYGFYNRKHDYPISIGNFTEYIVDFKQHHYQITFWKSNRSDRWWMEVPVKDKRQRRHRLIPCSYQDYLQACREELPERLLAAYRRFG
ncbi:MAG: hypothetical protein AB8G11_13215 [Saprospiraceae bacterium]